jgi:CspA family cold shock protein
VPQGSVVRFDRRKGYGFIQPEDGGEDVFVHQNNINMEGFRYLQIGEKVTYELEVGEKGMKAVSVALLEPRKESAEQHDDMAPRPAPRPRPSGFGGGFGGGAPRFDRGAPAAGGVDAAAFERLRRKQERLISLMVEKGLIAPGDLDAVEAGKADATA